MIIRNARKESGQTLVEFALVIPLLLLLVFGIIEFGIVYHTKITITNAAREGARKAAVSSTADVGLAVENAVTGLGVAVSGPLAAAQNSSDPPDDTVLWDKVVSGDSVIVYVKGKVDIVVPIISTITGPTVTIPAKAVMRIEY